MANRKLYWYRHRPRFVVDIEGMEMVNNLLSVVVQLIFVNSSSMRAKRAKLLKQNK